MLTLLRRCVKDPFPGISHWIGLALSVFGLVALLIAAAGRPQFVIGFGVYGSTLVLLYFASALAHSVHCSERTSDLLERLDYCGIFLLIAGTYTPVCLLVLRGAWGTALLIAIWTMAAIGIISVWVVRRLKSWARVMLFIAMGWLAIVAAGRLIEALPTAGLVWLIAGGVVYSLGAIVFITDRPRHWAGGRFVAHDLWHLMVLAGSACHFVMIYSFARA